MSANATLLSAAHIKRLRVFAGPNGSGKSSIYNIIAERFNVGVYVNADELQNTLSSDAGVSLLDFDPSLRIEDFRKFYDAHPLPKVHHVCFPFREQAEERMKFGATSENALRLSYAVAVFADFLRVRLIEKGVDLSFETVFSHPSKLSLMQIAKEAGYRVYLYYVCVASSEIAKQRVALRVTQGGHGVPDEKIVERYEKSLALLKDAIALSDRAYLFDNTYSGASLKIEINQASEVLPKEPQLPEWITRSLPTLVPDLRNVRKGGVRPPDALGNRAGPPRAT
ncbi:MAG: zeta toxin family protein [Kiritimatiellae bacterium]|nr:zeta toxin family protein [Kiritimatiellia bacterium]